MNAEPASNKRVPSAAERDSLKRYWQSNIKILTWLLGLWAILGLGCGVLAADVLNRIEWFGYPLGFWFAQQGAIIGFVVIIFIYCVLMNRLDARHHRELELLREGSSNASSDGGSA